MKFPALGSSWRRPGIWTWGPSRSGPVLEVLPEGLPEAGAGAPDDDGDAPLAEEDTSGGLEEEGPEALAAHPVLAFGVQEFSACGHEIGGEKGEEKLGLVRGEGVVVPGCPVDRLSPVMLLGPWGGGEGGRDGCVAVPEVGLGGAPLPVPMKQGLGAFLLGGGIGKEEEVVQEEMLLGVRTLDDDEDDAASPRPRGGPVGELS